MGKYISVDATQALKDVKTFGAHLSEEQLNLALARAINKTLLKVRTQARNEVKNVFAVPQKYLSDFIDIEKSTRKNLVGTIRAKSKPLPLNAFNPSFRSQTKSLRITKKGKQVVRTFNRARKKQGNGTTVEIYKGVKEIVPFAFMLEGKGKVFARGKYKSGNSYGFQQRHSRVNDTGNDTPINSLISVSVYGTIVNPVVMGKLNAMVPGELLKAGKHEIEFLTSQIANGNA
jgi:hypothetical protein